MTAMPLRAYAPDLSTNDNTFRCDAATVRLVLDWYEQDTSRPINSSSAEKERRRNRSICRDAIGNRLVADCKPFHLLDLINSQLDASSSNWTRRRWNNAIQCPFNKAERLGLIVKNPFRGLSFPEGDEGRDWTNEELSQVLAGANLPFRRLIIGLRLSGLRPHEGCDLRWTEVRPELMHIEKHKTRYRTKRARCVPLNAPLVKLLAYMRRQNFPGAYVFPNTKGRPWTRTHADSNFRRLRESLGLPDDLKLHGCRHTFGTHAVLNGVDLVSLAMLLGHDDPSTTKKYVHLANKVDHLAGAMNQAVVTRPRVAAKPPLAVAPARPVDLTPLFDGLE